MLSFKRFASPTLAALIVLTVPAVSALAVDSPAKAVTKEVVKEQAKDQSKEQGKSALTDKSKEQAKDQLKQPVKDSAGQQKEKAKEQPKEAVKEQAKAQPKLSPNDVLAKVNGTEITRKDVDRAVKVMMAQNQVPQDVQAQVMPQARAAALEQLTAAELLYQAAAKIEIKNLEKQVADKVAENKAKFATGDEFEGALKSVDMTQKDMRDFSRKEIVITSFINTKFAEKTTVSDAEARKFYTDNLDAYFKKPESLRASHILVGVDEKASEEDRKKAKEKAAEILKRLKDGGDFPAIANAESSCPSSAQGGDLGEFGRGQMVPAFEKAAFALKPGEISEVVETQFGYHIIRVTEKREEAVEPFEEVKEKIVPFLKQQKVQKEVMEYVEGLKKTAKIETPVKP